MTKQEALERFTVLSKNILGNLKPSREEAYYEDIEAFHIVASRLNEIVIQTDTVQWRPLNFHPFYPVIKSTNGAVTVWYWSKLFFYCWLRDYMPVLENISAMKDVVDAFDTGVEVAAAVRAFFEERESRGHYITTDSVDYRQMVNDLWENANWQQGEFEL